MPMDLYQQEINDLCMPLKPEFEEYRLPPHSETTEYKTKNQIDQIDLLIKSIT